MLVAFHDADLARTCARPGRIDDLPWSEVSQARVDGREPIPLFEELLGSFPDARFNIDCKANSGLPAADRRRSSGSTASTACASAASATSGYGRLRATFGERLCSSFGPVQMASLRSGARVPFGGQLAQVPVKVGRVTIVTPGTVAAAHRRGYQVHVWTIDDADEMDAPARPRRRRDHDRPSAGAEGRAARARRVALVGPRIRRSHDVRAGAINGHSW